MADSCINISDTGVVYTWGWNGHGQLGLGDRTSHDVPQQVTGLEKYGRSPSQVHCGDWMTVLRLK